MNEAILRQKHKALQNDFDDILRELKREEHTSLVLKVALDNIKNNLKKVDNVGYWIENEEGIDIFVDVKDIILEIIKEAELTINAE